MRRGTRLHFSLACLATAVAIFGSAAEAVAACQNIIRVYYSRPGLPCPQNDEDGCAPSGCPYNERLFGYPWVDFQCPNHPGSALCDDPGNEYVEWVNANRPQGVPDRCENPWSGVFYSCDTLPEPNDCRDPRNGKDTLLGDPVDLATGELEQSAVDVDLGRGLAFRRHYASDRSATTTMGKGWQQNLDWRLDYQAEGSDAEIVLISRPLSSTAVFVRVSAAYDPETYWKSSLRGAGGLEGEAATGFTFTDDDGTRVTFDGESFDLESIRRPGEPTIVVNSVGSTTTFANGSACLAVTKSASRVSSVVSYMNGGCTSGTTDAAWTYSYDGDGCLRTVAGQNPANPGEPLTWTYTYPSTAGNCDTSDLTKVERTVGAGAAVTVGAWSWQGHVVSAREPALAQDLCLGYASANNNLITSVCAMPASGTCNVPPATACGPEASPAPLAIFTSNSGRLVSVGEEEEGGPDVEAAFIGATFTPAGGAAPGGLWRTRTDPNGNVTWFDGYDPRGRPARIVEGWVDTNGNNEFNAGDGFARDREFTHHPRLGGELSVTETSVLNSAAIRVSVEDYDADLDSTPNEDPTDLLHRQVVQGWTLDAGGSQEPFTDTTTYSYDSSNRLTGIAGPRSAQLTTISYDATSGSRSGLRRYLNGTGSGYLEWTFSDFDALGNPGTVTDPNERATTLSYDTLGRVLTATPPYEGTGSTTIIFTYDIDGNLTSVVFPNDSAGNPVSLALGYDTAKPDLLRFIKDSLGNAIVYSYERGRATREERYTDFTSLASPGTKVGDATFSYTAAGHLFRAFNPLFGSNAVFSQFGHDRKGNPTSVSDENGKQDMLLYDALDRLETIRQVRAATYETHFDYDALSNVTGVTDAAGRSTDLLHDDRGNLVETVSPDTGRMRFLYDAAGNLTQKVENAPATGAGGRVTTYGYDGLDRLTSINLPNDADWSFSYDTDAAKNQKGRLAQVSNGIVTTQLEYTQRGDIAVERTIVDGLSYAVRYTYDAAGNRSALQAPSNNQAYTFYAGLRPSSMNALARNQTRGISGITWYPFGPRTQAKFPPQISGTNSVTSTRVVNLRGQITELDVVSGSAAILDRSYKYDYTAGTPGPNDPGPNLDRVVDILDATESRFYFYDELDRLQQATSLTGSVLHEYSYDAVGNRASKTDGAAQTDYDYEGPTGNPTNNRLDAATGAEARDYAHDAFGNRIYDGATAYTSTPSLLYDDANRLVEVRDPANGFATLATYTYDSFGRRVKKATPTRTILFFYDTQGHLIEEIGKGPGASDDTVRTYVFLEDELVGLIDDTSETGTAAWVMPGGFRIEVQPLLIVLALALAAGLGVAAATRRWPVAIATTSSGLALLLLCAGTNRPPPRFAWVHTDPLGTPLAVTDTPASGTGLAVWRARYQPFGKATVNEDPDGNAATFALNVRFPGQYSDSEMGWHYNMHRTYDPSTGRYLEVDPLGLTGRSTYEYAFSNPLTYVDPLGLIEMNWFPPGSPEFNNASQIGSGYPVYGFAGHGNPSSVSDPQENAVGPLGLATAIGRDPAWGGRSVVLYSCNTGRGDDPFAQLLADALGVLVLAPDNFGWLPPPSNPIRFLVAPPIGGECCNENLGSDCCREFFDGVGEKPQPDLGNPGRWRVFVPRGNPTIGAGR